MKPRQAPQGDALQQRINHLCGRVSHLRGSIRHLIGHIRRWQRSLTLPASGSTLDPWLRQRARQRIERDLATLRSHRTRYRRDWRELLDLRALRAQLRVASRDVSTGQEAAA